MSLSKEGSHLVYPEAPSSRRRIGWAVCGGPTFKPHPYCSKVLTFPEAKVEADGKALCSGLCTCTSLSPLFSSVRWDPAEPPIGFQDKWLRAIGPGSLPRLLGQAVRVRFGDRSQRHI